MKRFLKKFFKGFLLQLAESALEIGVEVAKKEINELDSLTPTEKRVSSEALDTAVERALKEIGEELS